MARHYSPKNFFRQMSSDLLARYFREKGQGAIAELVDAENNSAKNLFDAWLRIPDEPRKEMDAEFGAIFELSCEKGFHAIRDEAEWQLLTLARDPQRYTAFVDKLAGRSNHFERAMITFLDYNQFWKGATLFYHADTLSNWRKRKNLPHRPAAVDPDSLQRLADLIRDYFHRTEGRGNNCVVEPYRRGERDYFYAYPEDYSQQAVEWVNGQFGRRPHNPAFEVVYVYSQKDGTLDLSCPGAYKAVEPLQGMFAEAILKLPELPPDPKDGRVYDLNPLGQRNFNFVFDVGSGIQSIVIRKLRLSSVVKKGDRITLEADATQEPSAVYALMEKIGRSLPLHFYNVTHVEIAASVITDAGKPAKTVTFRLTHPNSCSLKYDELDLKLRDMLHASSIEPHEQPGPANALVAANG